jgi:hypothetical protein
MSHFRRQSAFTVSRREFLPALLQEALVLIGSFKGRQSFRLSEMCNLPDDRLVQVRPMVNPEHEIFMDEGRVCSRARKTGATLVLFPIEGETLAVFNLFNGSRSLGEIGRHLAGEMGWDEAEGFARAKELFLSLVNHLVCVPRDPIKLDQ